MKKVILSVALSAVIFSAPLAFANNNLSQTPSSHPVYADDGTSKIIGYVPDADWNRSTAEQTERNGQKLPIVRPGQSVTDQFGFGDVCPTYFLFNCVDLSHTDVYVNAMKQLAQHLISSGMASQFPSLQGWINSVR